MNTMNNNAMNINQAALLLDAMLNTNIPVMLWGEPGVGKSDLIRQVAEAHELPLIDVRASQLDAVDTRGIPFVNDGITRWAAPNFLPRADRDGENGLLFFDELTNAPRSVQAALYQLFLDRKLGDYVLPNGWRIVAAGNRTEDRAAATGEMSTALKNRLAHIDIDVDAKAWKAWALANDIRQEVISFIDYRPEMLHQFDPRSKDKAFPTPRSVARISDVLNAGIDPAVEVFAYTAVCGTGFANEFAGFMRIWRTLPDIDAILDAPDSAPIPIDSATMYATCGALVNRCDEESWNAITIYADRVAETMPEYNVLLIRDCAYRHKDKGLMKTKEFVRWAAKNKGVLF